MKNPGPLNVIFSPLRRSRRCFQLWNCSSITSAGTKRGGATSCLTMTRSRHCRLITCTESQLTHTPDSEDVLEKQHCLTGFFNILFMSSLARLLLLPSCFKRDVTLRTTFTAPLVHIVQWPLCTRYSFTTENQHWFHNSLFFKSCFNSQGIKLSCRQRVHVYAAA